MNFELKHGLIWITFELIYEGNSVIIDNRLVDTILISFAREYGTSILPQPMAKLPELVLL